MDALPHGNQHGEVQHFGRPWAQTLTGDSGCRARELWTHAPYGEKYLGWGVLPQPPGVWNCMIWANSHRSWGSTGGGRDSIYRKSRGVDCWANAIPRVKRGEMWNICRRPKNTANWGITATIKLRPPVGLGGGNEPLLGQGPCRSGVTERWHQTIEETSRPAGHIFLGFLWDGGSLGSFSTAPPLPQPKDVVEGPPGANTLIPGWLRPGIG